MTFSILSLCLKGIHYHTIDSKDFLLPKGTELQVYHLLEIGSVPNVLPLHNAFKCEDNTRLLTTVLKLPSKHTSSNQN